MRVAAPAVILALLAAGCGSAPAPAPAPVPSPAPSTPVIPVSGSTERAVGTVRVTAAGLNVRREPSTSADIVVTAKRGEVLSLLTSTDDWSKVRLADGTVGWVASRFVERATGEAPRPARRGRAGCPPDSDFSFLETPRPNLTPTTKHGLVTVDVTVDAKGRVAETKVVSNTTGDEALARLAAAEIRGAKFVPPVRNCVARAFIYTYKRSF